MTMSNPPWQRDELILALELYFKHAPSVPGPQHPEIVALSRLLKSLPIHGRANHSENFRGPRSIRSKLYNFRPHDPAQKGKGRQNGNHLDGEVFGEFATRRDELAPVARAIREGSRRPEVEASGLEGDEDEETFPEGRVLYRLHRARERNAKLVARAKKRALSSGGALQCAVCRFDFAAKYGLLGVGYIECHHTRPISELAEREETRLDDVALVCSNCHRMIHRRRPWLTISQISGLLVEE